MKVLKAVRTPLLSLLWVLNGPPLSVFLFSSVPLLISHSIMFNKEGAWRIAGV